MRAAATHHTRCAPHRPPVLLVVLQDVLSRLCAYPPFGYWAYEDELAQLRVLEAQEASICGLLDGLEDHRQWCEQQWSSRRWRGKRREVQRRQRQERKGERTSVRTAKRGSLRGGWEAEWQGLDEGLDAGVGED